MIVCTKCGLHNDDGVDFCASCGAFLEFDGAVVPDEPAPTVSPGATVAEPPPPAAPEYVAPPAVAWPPADPAPPVPVESPPSPPVEPPAPAPQAVAPVTPEPVLPGAAAPRPARRARRTAATTGVRAGEVPCAACGQGNEPTRHFCSRCGTPLVAAAPVASTRPPWWRRFGRRTGPAAAGTRRGGPRQLHLGRWIAAGAVLVGAGLVAIGPLREPVLDLFRDAKRSVQGRPTPVRPTGIEAIGVQDAAHSVLLAFDGVRTTHWQPERVQDGPSTPGVRVRFSSPTDVDRIGITPGAQDAPPDFVAHPRPKVLVVSGSDGSTQTITLQDSPEFQTFDLDARNVTSLEITVAADFGGTPNEAGAVAEIELFRLG